MADDYHVPVMLEQTLEYLVTDRDGLYADCTLGGGGHTRGILERTGPDATVYAFDADPGAIAYAEQQLAAEVNRGRLVVQQAYFSDAIRRFQQEGVQLSGILLDLGVSSRQLDSDQIGLSYRQQMPLDMRFDPTSTRPTARDLVNRESVEEVATILRRFGEERAAWKIAQAIKQARSSRSIETTTDLREIIERVIPKPFVIKTLSRVFQALRIAVNDELGELELALEGFTGLLKPAGRFVVLSYHSLEDRIVKERFRYEERECICPPSLPICRCDKTQRLKVLTRKPVTPSEEEIVENPRARSAKLRAAERVIDNRPPRSSRDEL
jgi:16S rRNA (cytosine1402-N4)-methyltransferase